MDVEEKKQPKDLLGGSRCESNTQTVRNGVLEVNSNPATGTGLRTLKMEETMVEERHIRILRNYSVKQIISGLTAAKLDFICSTEAFMPRFLTTSTHTVNMLPSVEHPPPSGIWSSPRQFFGGSVL